jgi:hypothetical protein
LNLCRQRTPTDPITMTAIHRCNPDSLDENTLGISDDPLAAGRDDHRGWDDTPVSWTAGKYQDLGRLEARCT